MAKFCKYCGTPLEEGQVCTCTGAQNEASAPVATATAPAAASALNSTFNAVKEDFLGYLRAPDATVRAAVNKGLKIPAIFAGINALAAFFYCWKLIVSILTGIMDAFGASAYASEVSYPVFLFLLIGILFTVVYVGLSALGLFSISKLTKRELTFTQTVTIASYHTLIPTLLLLAGILLGFISLTMQLIVLPIALIIWSIFAVRDAKEYAGMNATVAGKNLLIQTVVTTIVAGLAIYLSYQLMVWGLGEVSADGQTLKESFKAMSEGLSGLLGGMGGF